MLALISDIHSNAEALSAVLADIESRGIDRIICLGDVVGYGPDPGPCLDTIMDRCSAVIMGNHDCATLYEPGRFNIGAANAIYWTRSQLQSESDPTRIVRRWEFLGSLDVRKTTNGEDFGFREVLLVHGSPRRPINEYLFPDDVHDSPEKVAASMDRFEHICFAGHTHVPGVFTESLEFLAPGDLGGVYETSSGKALINVGSVGQPRDGDPRAGYVTVEGGKVTFVRVEYDVRTTMDKVYAVADLDDYLGTRLQDGR